MSGAMEGKTVLVTGGTAGIGKVTVRELAKAGAHVAFTTRDPAKGDAVAGEIRRAAPGAKVDVLRADMAKMRDVRALAAEVKRRYPRLDVLVNNAGGINYRRELTVDGLERTFAVNHLAYFLLTRELLELLRASAPARIVNVASNAHRRGRIHFEDLQLERGYSSWRAYSQSKLANVLFTRELARRLEGSAVTASSLHPGVVATQFGRSGSRAMDLMYRLVAPFLISPEKGAETTLHLSTSPAVEGRTGGYWARSREVAPAPQALDDAAARRLWEESERILARVLPQ